jgi:endonuclease/exonuclease/phosphatase family metal-dependent hydrolase
VTLRIATFNLLHGLSLSDGGYRDADLRTAAKSIDADVLGLQEVDRCQERSGSSDQTALVAEALGARWHRFVPALHGTPGQRVTWTAATVDDGALAAGPTYGVGMVSRLPVRSWRVLRFPPAPIGLPLLVPAAPRPRLMLIPDEPRLALAAVVERPGGGLMTVVTAHLSFVPGWNVRQLRRIVRGVADLPAPRLLVGDLNLVGDLPRLATGWSRLARVATYPSHRPRVQFDHALGDGIGPAAVAQVLSMPLGVSDHCALVLDLTP